jgi:hypothetical protein
MKFALPIDRYLEAPQFPHKRAMEALQAVMEALLVILDMILLSHQILQFLLRFLKLLSSIFKKLISLISRLTDILGNNIDTLVKNRILIEYIVRSQHQGPWSPKIYACCVPRWLLSIHRIVFLSV